MANQNAQNQNTPNVRQDNPAAAQAVASNQAPAPAKEPSAAELLAQLEALKAENENLRKTQDPMAVPVSAQESQPNPGSIDRPETTGARHFTTGLPIFNPLHPTRKGN